MKNAVFVILQYELPHLMGEKGDKDHGFADLLFRVELDFDFLYDLVVFNVFFMGELLKF